MTNSSSTGLLVCILCGTAFAWDPIPKVDLAQLRPADFQDTELDLPFYLAHFKELADAVVEQGPDRGFIHIPVWRSPRENQPYNARIMESVLSLAYFYTLKRPWNPYYASPAVRQRLEAALEYYCNQQNPEGRFAEAAPQRWNLAATAFFTKFITRTLTLLKDGPPVDAALLQRVTDADRKTIHLVLTDADLIKYGTFVSNQYTNVFAGGLEFLKFHPDAEIASLLRRRFQDGMHEHQSPAGHFYEEDGSDIGYDIFTHQSNLAMAWHYARGTDLGNLIAEQERKWFQWLSYNAVPEKDWSDWVLNCAMATRTRTLDIPGKDTPAGELVPETRAFATSREDLKWQIAAARRRLEDSWPHVPPLTPDSMSPYAFLLRGLTTWYPTGAQRDEARRNLPYFARKEFAHQLVDDRHPEVYTYIRRPAYYAAFNSGDHMRSAQQRHFGLGLLWSEAAGPVLQSQEDAAAGWGTVAEGAAQVYEAGDLHAVFAVAGKAVQPKPGSADLPQGRFTITYQLGDKGEKSLEFAADTIVVRVRHGGSFTEIVPLLESSAGALTVSVDPPSTAARVETNTEIGRRKLSVLRIQAKDTLTYRLAF
ncbi:conserved exported hypothetical protein [Candidatus Sulfopaludibacter sp. SbA3]|nr:conserved exported hypothetical protein [Candidatus Sulfopaludibacter sp. SbA3]